MMDDPQLPAGVSRVISELLIPFKNVAKQLSAFGPSLLGKVHPITGRIHASFRLAGTVTGRMSCSKPNLQQIPRGPDFRVLFQTPSGRRLVIADFSQIELRVAAMLANERGLLAAYEQGKDTHRLTAAMLLGKNDPESVTKQERQLAKAVNFGLLYGQGTRGLRHYARTTYQVPMTEQAASQHRRRWFEAYPAFKAWHLNSGEAARRALAVETPSGRWRRWIPDKFRVTQAFNTPVQAGGAEAMLASLGELARELNAYPIDAVPVAVVHDELILECAENVAEETKALVERAMVRGFLTVFPDACIRDLVEAHAVTAWSEKP